MRCGPPRVLALGVLVIAVLTSAACQVSGNPDPSPTPPPAPTPSRSNVLLDERFEGQQPGRWRDGEVRGAWRAVYDGFGETTVAGAATSKAYLSLAPRRAANAKATHGALVVSQDSFDGLDVTAQVQTLSQLRDKPNAWEVPWLLWHYTGDQHFYYVVLKPNGWELGKEDPAYRGAQRFLRTGTKPRFRVGTKHSVRVRQVGTTMTVWGDGKRLTTFTDAERPYRFGSVGLYTEDAEVAFHSVLVRRP